VSRLPGAPEHLPLAASAQADGAGPGDAVDLGAILAGSNALAVLEALDRELIGLMPVKARVRELAALLVVDKARRQLGIEGGQPSLHMCFTGNPGTGKTTVALRMAEILRDLGYLERGHLVVASRDDLVGEYVGHTAPKTKAVLKRAMGGVLFVDEAYALHRPENERDYGVEAIDILMQTMEAARDKLVVVLAGYKDRMDAFFGSNPGMGSRIAHHIEFPDYSQEELLSIAELMLGRLHYRFSASAKEAFRDYLRLRVQQPRFANARSVRNALDRARLRHASRLFAEGGQKGRDALTTLEADDIRRSRVFAAQGA
jgi:probable Rubsico expression protein CbbX